MKINMFFESLFENVKSMILPAKRENEFKKYPSYRTITDIFEMELVCFSTKNIMMRVISFDGRRYYLYMDLVFDSISKENEENTLTVEEVVGESLLAPLYALGVYADDVLLGEDSFIKMIEANETSSYEPALHCAEWVRSVVLADFGIEK